jgi:gluconokinase
MNPMLIQSQFDALEEPDDAIVVDISGTPHAIVDSIRVQLGR